MNPTIIINENSEQLKFTISNIDVTLVNAIRRTLLSDIPVVAFRTTPYSENKCNIIKNTTRHNNEIIKQRLSCVPIHINDMSMPIEQYIMHLKVQNNSSNVMFVTSKDFKVINKETQKEISEKERDTIFPPDKITNQYIDLARLRPSQGDNLIGEELELTCDFIISTAKENSMFNAVCTSAYGNTIDKVKVSQEWIEKEKKLKKENLTEEEFEYSKKNWYLLDSKRSYIPNSFDFVIESVDIYTNIDLLKIACKVLIKNLNEMNESMYNGKNEITKSLSTIDNCYDIKLYDIDHTLGKIVEAYLYFNHFEGDKTISYLGFKKEHPHDTYSFLRIAYNINDTDENQIVITKEYITNSIKLLIKTYEIISSSI